MEPEIYIPHKSVYQIYLTRKTTDEIFLSTSIIAWNESKAIEKVKIGSIVKELGLKRSDVDFYISPIGQIYEGDTFGEVLAKTPVLTADEKANIGKTIESRLAVLEVKK